MRSHLNCILLTSGGLYTLLLFMNVPAFSKHCRLFSFISVLAQKQIDLKSMLGVYIVLLGGIVFAFITLIAEMYWERRIRRRVLNTFRR